MKTLFWLVVAVTFGIYIAMLAWSIPAISAAAGGLAVFDLRPGGYSFTEAQDFLAALTTTGREAYLGTQHRLDTAFPLFVALTIGWSIWRLLPAGWGWVRIVPALPGIVGMVFDYRENAAVAVMLRAGVDNLTPDMVATASSASQIKAVFMTIAMVLLLAAITFWAVRRWRARRV